MKAPKSCRRKERNMGAIFGFRDYLRAKFLKFGCHFGGETTHDHDLRTCALGPRLYSALFKAPSAHVEGVF